MSRLSALMLSLSATALLCASPVLQAQTALDETRTLSADARVSVSNLKGSIRIRESKALHNRRQFIERPLGLGKSEEEAAVAWQAVVDGDEYATVMDGDEQCVIIPLPKLIVQDRAQRWQRHMCRPERAP